MAKSIAPSSRFWLLALCIIVGYGAIGFRLVELHALKRGELLREVQDRRYRVITENPQRGDVFDANMELLATSRTFMEVGLDPSLIDPDDWGKLDSLANLLDMSRQDVGAAFGVRRERIDMTLNRDTQWRLLKRRVEETVYDEIRELGIHGVYGTRQHARVYPKSSLASHIIGYVRQDGEASAGVERAYDFYLSGQKGWKESEVKGGEEMAQFRRREVPSQDGMDIVLSLDSYVQYTIEEELASIAKNLKPVSATIIVSDPYTGFILGLGNYPNFDPNHYEDFALANHKNRALTDPVEPGSTFKIVAASGALEERLVKPWTQFDCGLDTMRMPSGSMSRVPKDSHPHGVMTVEEIVAKSSNRGAAHLGLQLGEKGFYEYVTRFGFGESSGFGLGIESRGILRPLNRWSGTTIAYMPMGHEIGATPMQIHFAMASVANGGVLMRPQVVTKILDADGSEVMEFGPMSRRRVISYQSASTVGRMLEKTVSREGTAAVAAIPGYRVAGKTGTSQKVLETGGYSHSKHVGSFTGFFPANDPKVVITVIVDEADLPGVAYGTRVAAPSFKKIATKLIPYYAIMPANGSLPIASQSNSDHVGWGH